MKLQIELYKTNGAHGLEVETIEEVCDRYTVQGGCLNLYKEVARKDIYRVPDFEKGHFVEREFEKTCTELTRSYSGLAWKSVKVIE